MYIPMVFIIFLVLIVMLFLVYVKKTSSVVSTNKQLFYYESIVDSSQDIILFFDSKDIIAVNKAFFHYFEEFKTLEDFLQNYDSLESFFEEKDGYLLANNNGLSWKKYVLAHKDFNHKVKMKIAMREYYFSFSYSLIDKEREIYTLVLRDITEQERLKNELFLINRKDKLTEIGNKQFYKDELSKQIILAQRYRHHFSLLLLDIDSFKEINNKFGYEVGNKLLKKYANLIAHRVREVDVFCRIEGNRFTLILSHTTRDKAYILAEILRKLIEDHKQITPATLSLGVVEYLNGDDVESIYTRAEMALDKAKESGKNRVVLG